MADPCISVRHPIPPTPRLLQTRIMTASRISSNSPLVPCRALQTGPPPTSQAQPQPSTSPIAAAMPPSRMGWDSLSNGATHWQKTGVARSHPGPPSGHGQRRFHPLASHPSFRIGSPLCETENDIVHTVNPLIQCKPNTHAQCPGPVISSTDVFPWAGARTPSCPTAPSWKSITSTSTSSSDVTLHELVAPSESRLRTSGAPWIQPAHSMQKVVWNTPNSATIPGASSFTITTLGLSSPNSIDSRPAPHLSQTVSSVRFITMKTKPEITVPDHPSGNHGSLPPDHKCGTCHNRVTRST